jgi:hypothetical protein
LDRIDRAIKLRKFVCFTSSLTAEAMQKQFSLMKLVANKINSRGAPKKTGTTIFDEKLI